MSIESARTPDPNDREQVETLSPANLLQAQVNQLTAQLEQAHERETRLLALLEAEQQARRELEQKLLPAPSKPAPIGNVRRWILLALLVLAIVATIALHPEWVR